MLIMVNCILNNKILKNYLMSTIGKIYKIIPLYEEHHPTLKKYINSLKCELIGNINNFNILKSDGNFISIIGTLEYLTDNDFDKELCKREVFKCINTIEILIGKLKNEAGDL